MIGLWVMHPPRYSSDYKALSLNGMGYTREVAGFTDLLKRGCPEPADPRTVLLELRSPQCPPVLWATGQVVWVPVSFVARGDFIDRLHEHGVTGFETCPVEVVKVASRGRGKRSPGGEPEDQILKRGNMLEAVRDQLPPLLGVIVTGRLDVRLVGAPTSDPRVQRYVPESQPSGDLCRPFLQGKHYGGHLFCTSRVLDIVSPRQDNVAFTSFDQWKAEMWPEKDS